MPRPLDVWLAARVRTPFAKVDGPLAGYDAIEFSGSGGAPPRHGQHLCRRGQGSVLLLETA
jgi:hypothetical protein